MKWFSLLLGLITLLAIGCATPSEPEINEEQEKLTYDTIKNTDGYVYDLVLYDNKIFAAEDQAGFSIYSLTGTLLENYYKDNISARAIHISTSDSLIYLYNRTGSPGGLTLFHFSTMLNEVFFEIYGDTAGLKDIFTLDDEALKVYWSGGTEISSSYFNEELNWWEAGQSYEFPAPINKLHHDEDRFYVTGAQLGIFVMDIETGNILQTINTPGEARDVKFVDNTLFVACQEEGFQIIDIADLNNPIVAFHTDTSGYAQSIAVENSLLAVGSGGGGVYVYDVSDIYNPEYLGRISTTKIGYTQVVKIKNNEIYAGTKTGIYKISLVN
jgi:hypothetical protein